MNKNRGIWFTIVMITVIGIAVTWGTSTFVNRKVSSSETTAAAAMDSYDGIMSEAEEEAAGTDSGNLTGTGKTRMQAATYGRRMAEEDAGTGDYGVAAADAKMEAQSQQAAADSSGAEAADPREKGVSVRADGTSGQESGTAPGTSEALDGTNKAVAEAFEGEVIRENSVVISPLGPAASIVKESGTSDSGEYYRKRLEELDAQIKKMRGESSDSNTYTVQALADQELKMWNDELSVLYSAITASMDEESRKTFETSCQTWLKERDKKAETAARKYSGGSLEGVEYTAALAKATRQRAYDLIVEYADTLSAGE